MKRRDFVASLAPLPFLGSRLIEPKMLRAEFFLRNLEGDEVLRKNLELREGSGGFSNSEAIKFVSPGNQGIFASVKTEVGGGYSAVYNLLAGDLLVFSPGSVRVEF